MRNYNPTPEYNTFVYRDKTYVEVAVPGAKRENLSVKYDGCTLSIRSSTSSEPEVPVVKYDIRGIRQELSLDLKLPDYFKVDFSELEDGILRIVLSKSTLPITETKVHIT